jgi:hypothetical protein
VGTVTRAQRFRAAPYPPQLAFLRERRDVTPDGRLGSVQKLDELRHAHDRALVDEAQDKSMAFSLEHARWPASLVGRFRGRRRISIKKVS